MGTATNLSGMTAEYAVEQRDKNGKLLYRETSVMLPEMPKPPVLTCPNCIPEYKRALDKWGEECKKAADLFELLRKYHFLRGNYCRRHRNDEIDEKYRTGEPAPLTIEQAKKEIKNLRR